MHLLCAGLDMNSRCRCCVFWVLFWAKVSVIVVVVMVVAAASLVLL